jgi:hypothetical protein
LAGDAAPRAPIRRIIVRVVVGTDRMAASDDPLFLELLGPGGREFRLQPAHGKALRRGAEDEYVLAGPKDPATNVAHPELNDPTDPPLDATLISGACVRKGTEPIPNVRGFGEMDDRLQLLQIQLELHVDGESEARRFERTGPIWLGLVCGQRVHLQLLSQP